MTKRRWLVSILSVLLLVGLVVVWNLSGMPPEDSDLNRAVQRTMLGMQDVHTSSFTKWRLELDIRRRPDAYAAMFVRQVKDQPADLGWPRWGGLPIQFYDAMAKWGEDPDPRVRAASAQALLTSEWIPERRKQWIPLVIFWLQDTEQRVVDKAILMAPLIVDDYSDAAGAEIRALAKSPSRRTRFATTRALTQILLFDNNPTGRDIISLEHLAKDNDPKVRAQASYALGKIGIVVRP